MGSRKRDASSASESDSAGGSNSDDNVRNKTLSPARNKKPEKEKRAKKKKDKSEERGREHHGPKEAGREERSNPRSRESRKGHFYSDHSRNRHAENDSRRKGYDDERRVDRTRDRRDDRSQITNYNNKPHKDESYYSKGYTRNRDNRESNRENRSRGNRKRSRSRSFDHAKAKWGKDQNEEKEKNKVIVNKEKPNFGLSGKLTEETNTYRGVVIKYSEPPEARKPKRRWRLYPFKGEKALQTLYIHRQSGYLIGRDRKIVDLPVDHPSCSKQHAALQYRLVPFTRDDGSTGKKVRPYLIDLESANGTYINDKRMDPKKYYELMEKDVIKFGFSSREYVLLHENSKDGGMDDDVKQEEEVDVKVKKEQ
ncbi:smad nuclear interacting protein 1 [Cylas formicarius]|uniref:smad nuclear interacting protein 1 n=1 Tax=Cylas formicarius TaxID=197179 RepID=UPI002958825C|nr:smad nuclear interacting protein 1 [Cylas formicarius]XP_060524247.1 smad nuclear interacting protein 1 [Cylas formicarius]